MIRVNLLASGTEPAHKPWHKLFVIPQEQRAALIGLTMLLATAIGVGTWWWSIDRERKRVDAEISVAEAALTQLKEASRLVELATAREADLKQRLALIDRLRATQRAPVVLLDTISKSLSEGLWLLDLKQNGAMVQLEGRAMSLSALTDFIDRLQVSGRFAHTIDIVTTSMETVASQSVVRFAIRGEVTALAGPEGDQ